MLENQQVVDQLGQLKTNATMSKPLQQPVVVIESTSAWTLFDWRECLEYRDLLYFLVLRDVTVLYKQTVLGIAWAVLNPFFSMVVFTVIFGMSLKVPGDGISYPIFGLAALMSWTYFFGALTNPTSNLIQETAIFSNVSFPRLFVHPNSVAAYLWLL
jgi:lipopolysaccharide transport system permease protein